MARKLEKEPRFLRGPVRFIHMLSALSQSSRILRLYTYPWAIMAPATFRNPATFAPVT